jgi:hypothetical protein
MGDASSSPTWSSPIELGLAPVAAAARMTLPDYSRPLPHLLG